MFPKDRVCVDSGRATVIGVAVAVDEIGIGDVDVSFIWREADAVRPSKTVRYHSDIACARVKAVYKLRELWFGPEALLIAVDWIRKPYRAIRVDNDVVGGVEGA